MGSDCINDDPYMAELLAEIGRLRIELWHEWWDNHAERCGTEWPHTDGSTCLRPPPKILEGCARPDTLARLET